MEKKFLDKQSEDDVANNTTLDAGQSHDHASPVNRIKHENLRGTKSSPHSNVKIHHTRSFSEICHLHPSRTDITCITTLCPKPRPIGKLQHELGRPESVLEMSEIQSPSDGESDEDAMAMQQLKGDEAMKIFLESNDSVPLDGNMTSSSISQDTLDSDIASESEMIVANWEREGRDSIGSTGSSLEKRFLTPSGQLLYREHQVDSMLDTKRLKLTPSSSERPMSPLAMRRSDESLKDRTRERRYRVDSDSENDDLNQGEKKEVGETGKRDWENEDLRSQDLKNLVRKYERQYEELMNTSKKQHDEIKTLRKGNVDMHKEHSRLQVLIGECHQKEDNLRGKLASFATEKEGEISELDQKVQELETNLQSKNSEISLMQTTICNYKKQGEKYNEVMHEINNEIRALFEALAKELGFDGQFEVDMEENPEAMVTLLKTRRQSLSDTFTNFYENLHKTPNRDTVRRIQNSIKEDFHQVSSGCQDTISKIQKAEKDLGKVLKHSTSLETLLKETKGRYDSDSEAGIIFRRADTESDMQIKINELQRKNNSLIQENKFLRENGSKWKEKYAKLFTSEKTPEVRSREETSLASKQLEKLQQILKQRRKSCSETHLTTLQDCRVDFTHGKSPKNTTAFSKYEQQTKNFERTHEDATESIAVAQITHNFEGLNDLEKRLKQLSLLAEDLNHKIEISHQTLVGKFDCENKQSLRRFGRVLSGFYGVQLFSVIKQIYDDNLATLQNSLQRREEECHYLKEKILVSESNEEIAQCCIDSLKRTVAIVKADFSYVKNMNEDLKVELRELKDRVLVTNAEREMSLFYCKKSGVANGTLIKHGECFDVDTSGHRHRENGFDIVDETSYVKKQINNSGT